ncbi:MAG TPA: chemotaxis protein CheB [Verrucomicrobiae bacterium]|nr:chemotaxis protein CheB [Verrucomicrobiae bacterium]
MKKVIVVGGSAGGIQALCSLLRGIPPDFPAPILAVIHIAEHSSALRDVLQRSSKLPVTSPEQPTPLRAGSVYVAPANRHLIVKRGCAIATMGPRENRHRPAVDTLFRSAARAYRRSVVAVVLSGALDDGSAGALAVKSRGGSVIVQDPSDAEVSDMPSNVMRQVKTDQCLKIGDIAGALVRMVSNKRVTDLPELAGDECEMPEDIAANNEPIAFTCPDCGGALLEFKNGKSTQLHCHVGHRFSFESFTEGHSEAVERAVWVALRKLRESQAIYEHLAEGSNAQLKKRYKENASAAAHDIKLLEEVLGRL